MKTKNTLKANATMLAFSFMLLTSSNVFAQACDASSFNMPNSSVNPCTGYIYDTGGPGSNYSNSENRTFIISPSGATSITLKFSQFSTENNWDFLKVYNTISGATGLLGTYTGSSVPSPVTSATGIMRLVFTSDGNTVSSGFAAIWTSVGGDCGSINNMPNSSTISSRGTLYDSGGPTGNYSNSEDKLLNITPFDATEICLKFTHFSTEVNYDYLKVYDDINGTGNLLNPSHYWGTTLPPDLTSYTGKMSIVFHSDGSNVSSGFAAIWSSDGTSRLMNPETPLAQETAIDNRIGLFPNPTDGKLTIGFIVKEAAPTKVIIYNVAGMETVVLDETLAAGQHTIPFNTASLAAGMYFCKVINGSTISVEKIIKK